MLLIAQTLLLAGCRNECGFVQQCDGNTLQMCGYPDQWVNRQVMSSPCTEPNPVCEQNGDLAACVAAPATACSASTTPICSNGAVLRCAEGVAGVPFLYATPCDEVEEAGSLCATAADGGYACRQ